MQDMAHFMHGSGDVAGAFRADAARLFGSIDALEGRKGQMPLAEFRDTATPVARRSRSPARPHRRGDTPQRRSRGRPRPHPRPHPVRPRRGHARPFRRAAGRPCLRRSQSGRQVRRARDPAARGPVPVSLGLGPARRPRHAARHGARPLQRQGQRNHDPPRCRGALARAAGPRNGRRRAHPADPGDSPGLRHAPDHDGNRGAPYHRRKGNRRLLSAFLRRTHPARHGGPVAPERGAKRLRARAVRDEKARGPDRKHAPAHARWDPRFRVSGGRRDAALDRGQPAGAGRIHPGRAGSPCGHEYHPRSLPARHHGRPA